MDIYLSNSLTKKIELFKPVRENEVGMYSCGPTVYNYAHIGNMRAFLFADLLQRTLRVVGGYKLKWVMNITNIDDKTIRDSANGSEAWLKEMGEQTDDPKENLKMLTDFYENSFIEDISKLGIEPMDFSAMPKATDYIAEMQDLIGKIIDKGVAYVSDGSVYFNVNEWRKRDVYGKLFYIDFDHFKEGVRIDADEYEREQVSDFVLWKGRKENEPYWEFEAEGQKCDGRPGWHIECSAMERELLGLPFDIHTGGIDLKFPHHEDEIAQSKAGYGVEPTNYWCHNEFLEVEGEKMSKSKGNFFSLRDLIDKGIDPIDIRFAMFSAHYASKYNFTFDGIKAGRKGRLRIQDYIYALYDGAAGNEKAAIDELRREVFKEFANDLHTPKALGKIFSFINNNPAGKFDAESKKALIDFFGELNNIFNCWAFTEKPEEKLDVPQEIVEMAEQRITARKERNFAKADELREKIQAAGYVVKDTKDSFVIEKL